MNMIFKTLCVVVLLVSSVAAQEAVSFKADIAPILINNCLACHGPKKAEGGYRVDTYERFCEKGILAPLRSPAVIMMIVNPSDV